MILSIQSGEESDPEPVHSLKCCVCQSGSPNYTCPKCEMSICCSSCYKMHSVQCTESFFESQVAASSKCSDAARQELHRVLECHRSTFNFSLEQDVFTPHEKAQSRFDYLAALIAHGNLTLEMLTREEAEEFRDFLSNLHFIQKSLTNNGLITALPWWFRSPLPNVNTEGLSHICCTEEVKPNWRVSLFLVEVIFVYTLLWRSHGGILDKDENRTYAYLLCQTAKNLSTRHTIPMADASETIHAILNRISQGHRLHQAKEVYRLCCADVEAILSYKERYLFALNHLTTILKTMRGINCLEFEKTGHHELRTSMRKLKFLRSFGFHHFFESHCHCDNRDWKETALACSCLEKSHTIKLVTLIISQLSVASAALLQREE